MPSKNIKYEPLPPYDLNDIEATAEASRPQDNGAPVNELPEIEVEDRHNVVEPNEERGRMSQAECCRWAFLYFLTVIVALIIITSLITHRRR